jgi:hypothetical protein
MEDSRLKSALKGGDTADNSSTIHCRWHCRIFHATITAFNTMIFISTYEYSPMLETTRTYQAKIVNHQQVQDELDDCGHSASKLWNVARYHIQQEWDATGEIPSEADLKRELKDHERYSDLHSQSSQRF